MTTIISCIGILELIRNDVHEMPNIIVQQAPQISATFAVGLIMSGNMNVIFTQIQKTL